MRAMILGAGLGTRLRPLTLERPKPAVPLGLRPMACSSIDAAARAGVREVIMNTHHLAEGMEAWLSPHVPASMSLRFEVEPALLGTAGGIANVAHFLSDEGGDECVILNGDIAFSPDLRGALRLHRALGAIATMIVRPDPEAARYGAIDYDEDGVVRSLLETPPSSVPTKRAMFTGVHVLSKRALEALPPVGCVIRTGYRRWIDQGEIVGAFVDRAPWRDLGTLPQYLAANVEAAQAEAPGNLIHGDAQIDPRATLEGCVVGAGAIVGPGDYTRVVFWPGSRAKGGVLPGMRDAIITPERVVRVPGS